MTKKVIELNVGLWLQILDCIAPMMGRGSEFPIGKHFAIEVEGGVIRARQWSPSLASEAVAEFEPATLPAGFEDGFGVCPETAGLYGFLKRFRREGGPKPVTATIDGDSMILERGKSKLEIGALPIEIAVERQAEQRGGLEKGAQPLAQGSAAKFADVFGKAYPFTCDDRGRRVLQAPLIERKGGVTEVVATDGHTMFVAPLDGGEGEDRKILLCDSGDSHKLAIGCLKGAAKALPDRLKASIAVNSGESHAVFAIGPIQIWHELSMDAFPDWRSVIPDGKKDPALTTFTACPGLLKEALKRLTRGKSSDNCQPMRVELDAKAVTITLGDKDFGRDAGHLKGSRIQEVVEAGVVHIEKGGPDTIVLNPAYLLKAVCCSRDARSGRGESVSVHLRTSDKAAVITHENDPSRQIVMPMRMD